MSKQPRTPERRSSASGRGGKGGSSGRSGSGRTSAKQRGVPAKQRSAAAKGRSPSAKQRSTVPAQSKKPAQGKKPAEAKGPARGKRPAGGSAAGRGRATGSGSSRRQPTEDRAATFRRRRAVVGVLALLVVAAVAFGVVQGVPLLLDRFGSDDPEPTAEPTDDATGPDEEALANPVGCQPDAVSVELALGAGEVGAGSQVDVPVSITNTGAVPCLLDVGNASLQLAVTSGEDTIWTTDQCPAGRDERQVLLATGAVEETTITWSGRRSAADCPNDTREARTGTYRVQVSLAVDGGEVSERQALTLN